MTARAGHPIREVVIAGGGIVGRSAAAALKKRMPRLSVTLLDLPPPPDALADRIGATLPSIIGFHADIGLAEADTVARAGSCFRLGTRFEGWTGKGSAYLHCYGRHGRPFGTVSFHHHWVRAAKSGAAEPLHAYSTAAAMAAAGRFVHPQGGEEAPLGSFEHGLRIDPPRYGEMLRAYCRHLGVGERKAGLGEVRLDGEDGFIEALRLDDGSELGGHLFIDCTGPVARLRGCLDDAFEDWGHWLPCDRILMAEGAPEREPPLLDRAIATDAGWRWESVGLHRASYGYVHASRHLSDGKAARALRAASPAGGEPELVPLRSGRRPEPWLRNCVAIGEAAVAVEPLEWTNLHLAHSAIDRIVAMMPDRACAPVELAEYNRQCGNEANRVRDFLALHYLAARRGGEPFWREAVSAEPPPSLAHTLRLFEERGRLPFYEEETFSRDSWLAVLLGQGIIPRRVDPLTDSVPADAAAAAMARMRAGIARLVATLPPHAASLRAQAERLTR